MKKTKKTINLARFYFKVKQEVIDAGYSSEIDWQEKVCFMSIGKRIFLREFAWVVLSCGMSEKVIRSKFDDISDIFLDWKYPEKIIKKKNTYLKKALKVFGNSKKIEAILYMAEYINNVCFSDVKKEIALHGPDYLQQFPYMGPATSIHFLKNIGFSLAKPDRHLIRISKHVGYCTPAEMCSELSELTYERIEVIDLVFWRYATLKNTYLDEIKKYIA